MDNSGFRMRANSSSFDSDSDYNGRYLKLFQQQTKNSKLNNHVSNNQQQKKDEQILLKNIQQIDDDAVYQYGGDYRTRRHNSGAISKQLDKMRDQHMRIMRIMDQDSPLTYEKRQQVEQQVQNKNQQQQINFNNSNKFIHKIQQQDNSSNNFHNQSVQKQFKKQIPFQNILSLNSSDNKIKVKQVQSKIIGQSFNDLYFSSQLQQKLQIDNKANKQPVINRVTQKQILTPATVLQDISEQPRSGTKDNNYFNYNNDYQERNNQHNMENINKKSGYILSESIQMKNNGLDEGISMLSSIQKLEAAFQSRKLEDIQSRPDTKYKQNLKKVEFHNPNNNILEIKKDSIKTQQKIKPYQKQKPVILQKYPEIRQQVIKYSSPIKMEPHIKLNAQIKTGNQQIPIQKRIFRQQSHLPYLSSQKNINTNLRTISPPRRISQSPKQQIIHVGLRTTQNRATTPSRQIKGLPHHEHKLVSPTMKPISNYNNIIQSAKSINYQQLSPPKIINSNFRQTHQDYFPISSSPIKNGITLINNISPQRITTNSPNSLFNRSLNVTRSFSPKPRLLSPKRITQHKPLITNANINSHQTQLGRFQNQVSQHQFLQGIQHKSPLSPLSSHTPLINRPISNHNLINNRPCSVSLKTQPQLIMSTQTQIYHNSNQYKIKQTPILLLPSDTPIKPKQLKSKEFQTNTDCRTLSRSKKAQRGISLSINSRNR